MTSGIYVRTQKHKEQRKEIWRKHVYSDKCRCRRCCSVRNEKFGGWKGWSKGLTKETDKRVERGAEKKKGRRHTEETKRKIRISNKGKHSGLNNRMYGKHHSKESRQSISKKLKGRGHPHTEETKQILRDYALEQFKNGVPEETRKKRSIAGKKAWSNPIQKEIRLKKMLKASWKRPTQLEVNFTSFFEEYNLPFEYVGNGKLIIGGKIPDFVETNGKKLVLEVGIKKEKDRYCDSWETYVNNRILHFKKYNWKCVVLWREELKNKLTLFKKLKCMM